jgi:hypothetical protein
VIVVGASAAVDVLARVLGAPPLTRDAALAGVARRAGVEAIAISARP